MKLFDTNQVLVFISLQGSRDWKLFHSSSEERFWRNQVDSKKRFKLGWLKTWILKKPSWWRLEESVTLCKILECLSFDVELMLKNHTHLNKLICTKIISKRFSETYVFHLNCRQSSWTIDSPIDRFFSENYRQVFPVSHDFLILTLYRQSKRIVDSCTLCISRAIDSPIGPSMSRSATAKFLAVAHWIVDSPIGLSTVPVTI